MTTQPTSGPWSISPDGVCVVEADTEYTSAVDKDGQPFQHPTKLIALPYGCSGRDRAANARLIAAAPRMLEALTETRELLDALAREPMITAWPTHPRIGQLYGQLGALLRDLHGDPQ